MDALWRDAGELLLSHHHEAHAERCIVVGGRRVCRRCAVLYPVSLAVMVTVLVGVLTLDRSLAFVLMLALPIPVTLEWLAENLLRVRYNRVRQSFTTLLAAPAVGIGFASVVRDRASGEFWTMVCAHGIPCALAWIVAYRRERARSERTRLHVEENHRVLQGFDTADEFRAYLDAEAERLGVTSR